MFSVTSLLQHCGRLDFSVDELIPKSTCPLNEYFKTLNKKPGQSVKIFTHSETQMHSVNGPFNRLLSISRSLDILYFEKVDNGTENVNKGKYDHDQLVLLY